MARVVRMLRWSSTTRILGIGHSLTELLCQVRRFSELVDEPELRLEPIDVFLFTDEHLGEERLGGVVLAIAAQRDGVVEAFHGAVLELEVALELLGDGLSDVERVEALEVRQPLEEQDAIDELLRVLHLVDRLGAASCSERVVA